MGQHMPLFKAQCLVTSDSSSSSCTSTEHGGGVQQPCYEELCCVKAQVLPVEVPQRRPRHLFLLQWLPCGGACYTEGPA